MADSHKQKGELMLKKIMIAASFSAALLMTGSVTAASNSDTYRQLELLMDVFERIRAEYVEGVEDEELIEAAINGMLTSLDPHSSYMGPDNFRQMQVQTRGEYGGLGMEVTMENGVVKVIAPMDDTPASRAGILSGDYITHIDGEPILGLTLDEALDKMKGPANTDINITVIREGMDEPMEFDLTRATIRLRSVMHQIEREDIGYVRITTFNEQATRGLRRAIRDMQEELGDDGMKGLILDLRNNPGGLLDEAIGVSDTFLGRGEVVSTRGRRERDHERYNAQTGDLTDGLPVIVLVNAGSASASEIVAGALQDHKRGIVLGEQTFGKGTVQTVIPLSAESAMRLTTSRYYTPSGRSIQEEGIEPDIEVIQPLRRPDGSEFVPRRERDLRGHLANGATGLYPEEFDDVEHTGHMPAALEDEDGNRIDFQLQYALDLLKGIAIADATIN